MPKSQLDQVPPKPILLLLVALFVTGIGFGITLPVLPYFALRLMGTSLNDSMSVHVTGLTSVYALMQFIFAPVWGVWSDRIGRMRVIQIGILGTASSQVFFGLSTSLVFLYAARILGGILSASLIPSAAAYIADFSTDENRPRHMAWLGTVSSLGTVAGLVLGGALNFTGVGYKLAPWHRIDSFSLPFLIAASLMVLTSLAVWRWLPEFKTIKAGSRKESVPWRSLVATLRAVLFLALAGQFALTLFEATFPIYAQKQMNYGPSQLGLVFMVCGLVMSIFQVILVSSLTHWVSAVYQLSIGFLLMAVGIFALLIAREIVVVLGSVGVLALGMAIITPNLSALAAKNRGSQTGASMGVLSAANNLGQTIGPLLGGSLLGWGFAAPYTLTGFILLAIGLFLVIFEMRGKLRSIR